MPERSIFATMADIRRAVARNNRAAALKKMRKYGFGETLSPRAKYCRCILDVKAKSGYKVNPWAVCGRIRPRGLGRSPCIRLEY